MAASVAGAHESKLIHARDQAEDFFGEFDFALGGSAEREAVTHCLFDCIDHRRMTVAEDHRTP